jgi:3-deoxy-D-manno-octulosonic-acid transferase
VCLHRLVAWFNPKAKQMVYGRATIDYQGLKTHTSNKQTWLFHCASLGEYEMALPMALGIIQENSARLVVFSFYSPSGYNHAKLPSGNFIKTYLPWDRSSSIRNFLNAINPVGVVIIRYEFWLELLSQINQRAIPVYLLGTSFREDQFLWKPLGSSWKSAISSARYIGVIKKTMVAIAQKHGLSNVHWFGDPKFSRAILRTQQVQSTVRSTRSEPEQELLKWMSNQNTLILGSSWPAEEKFLLECLSNSEFQQLFFSNNWKILIAPHDISENHCSNLLHQFAPFSPILFTEIHPPFGQRNPLANSTNTENCQIIILNTIGQLALAYSAAQVAIIGGGFGKGLHNITEALSFGVPVLFGPNHLKFPEAADAIEAGVAASFNNSDALIRLLLPWISDPIHRKNIGTKAIQFTIEHQAKIDEFVKLTENHTVN